MQNKTSDLEFISLKNKNSILFYCGVHHSWNPDDLQFPILKEKFISFLKESKNPTVVVETQHGTILSNEDETIQKGGEQSFMAFLCKQNNIPFFCFEPNRGEEMNALLERFTKEQIEYYYFARTVAQWHRLTEKPEIYSYLNRFLERDKKETGWDDFDFSIESLSNIHKKLFADDFNLQDRDFFQKIENPNREDNPLKEIVQASGNIRDDVVAKNIFSLWNNGQDVFVVYGNGHVKSHMDRIQFLLKNK
jgi:hypothetical protein